MNYETSFSHDRDEILDSEALDRRSRKRRIIFIAVAVVVLIAAAIAFMSMGGGDAAAPAGAGAEQQAPRVTVVVPGREAIERRISTTGTIAARREMPIGVVGEGGRVTRVLVEPGDWVGAGEVLATVDRAVQVQQANSLEAQINVARADARLAQAELDRSLQLVDRGFVSQADIERKTATRDAAVARVRVAEAQLAETRARNSRLDIRAPEAGLVLTRDVEPGQVVGAGSGVLFRLARGGEMELRAQLAEGDLNALSVGVPATVTPVGGNESFTGQVWQISPVINAESRQGIARIALKFDEALRPGGFAHAEIVAGAADAPLLPESAVLSDDRGNFVYVISKDNTAVRRDVTVGEVTDAGVAIREGLAGNERVVLSAGAFLNPDQKVVPVASRAAE